MTDRCPEEIITDLEATVYILVSKLGGWAAISPEEIAFFKAHPGATAVVKRHASGHRVLELQGPLIPKELATMKRAVLVDVETFGSR
jgi:hypothetical protein